MFERLAGKLLHRLLSKYFVQHHEQATNNSNKNTTRKSTQPSVWSGYISFQNLQLRPEVVNELLRSKGIALELVSGSIRSLEITIPWAKLGLSSTSSTSNDDDGAVVVVVLDGVHVLLRTKYEYDDEALRTEAISSRRNTLAGSESFGRQKESSSKSLSQMLHKRITEGILKDIMEKLHVHIRDVHVRLEDLTSDPINPFACGITLESLHVQAEDEEYIEEDDVSDVIRKEGQLNHFAVYWNAIDSDPDLPVELSILHEKGLSPLNLAKALNKCIARRGSDLSSPMRAGAVERRAPKHTYLLSPVDATSHVALSTNPENLISRPRLVASIQIDDLSFHLRDFQCAGIRNLVTSMKEHKFFKQYRPYRPQVSVKDDPKAWWRYANKVVRMELRESRMRWSWGRFHQRLELRRRYCHLYERQCRYPSTNIMRTSPSSAALQSLSINEPLDTSEDQLIPSIKSPDEGAGPASDVLTVLAVRVPMIVATTLSQEELDELKEIEDGVRGDLSILDIILYRALVNARLAGMTGGSDGGGATVKQKRSGFTRWVSSAVTDDVESEREYDRLIAYLDSASEPTDLSVDDETKCLVAVSVRMQLKTGCISLYSPLQSTADQKQHRRLQERFLDIGVKSFFTEVDVMGNIESYQLTITLEDFSTSELRANRNEYVILSRMYTSDAESSIDDFESESSNPLIYAQMTSDPPDHLEYDIGFHANLDAVEIIITPECEWIHRIRDLVPPKKDQAPSTASFWQNVSLSQLGSLGSDRVGWLARTARSIGDHKNLDLDIRVNCPVLNFSGSENCTLKVDLGKAHLVTESLAGVAIGKLNYAYKDVKQASRTERRNAASQSQQSSKRRSNQVTSITELTDRSVNDSNSLPMTPSMESRSVTTFPTSPRMDPFFLGSAASYTGSEARGFSGRSTSSALHHTPRTSSRSLHSSFYDKFRLRLSETRIYVLHELKSCEESILSDIDIAVSLEASVIPADASLCRFKACAAVNDVVVSVTKSSVAEIGGIAHAWKRSMKLARERKTSPMYMAPGIDRFNLRDQLMNEIKTPGSQREEAMSDSSSVVDENEFLDAFEGDGETEWVEENWVVDAESVIGGDIKSVKSARKRRRPRSISDVSSISDGSRNRTQDKANAAYLSAENLARLEEGGGEDDESELESDDESFHSAISFGGRIKLANTLLEDIANAETEIFLLEDKLKIHTGVNEVPKNTLHPNATKRRRQERQLMKVAIDRAKAELRALKASHQDLEEQNEIDVEDQQIEDFVDVSKSFRAEDSGPRKEDVAAQRAQSILRYRRKRGSSILTEGDDQETPTIVDQELFQGSFAVKSFRVQLKNDASPEEQSSLDFQLSQLTFAVSHRSRESKVFFGTDFLTLSMAKSGILQELLRGGNSTRTEIISRVGIPNIDRFLRVAFDFRRIGKSGVTSKGRIFFGGIDVSPEASLISAVSSLCQEIRQQSQTQPKTSGEGGVASGLAKLTESLRQRSTVQPTFHDLYFRCSSLRVCLLVDGTPPFGAIVLTDAGVRTSIELSAQTARVQCDVLCGNMQVYDYGEGSNFAQKELLGRRDHFGNILRGRFRIQCAPLSRLDGWATGHPREFMSEAGVAPEEIAVDVHFGLRVQPLQVIPFKHSLESFMRLRKRASQNQSPTIPAAEVMSRDGGPTSCISMRWRVDVGVQKISIIIPSLTNDHIDVTKMPDSALQLMLSVRVCAEHRKSDSESSPPIVRASIYDVAVQRSLDDWPILERATLSVSVLLSHPSFQLSAGSMLKKMDVPSDSHWSETNTLLRECISSEEPLNRANQDDDSLFDAYFTLSPVRLNASSSVFALLIRTLASYRMGRSPEQVGVRISQDRAKVKSKFRWNFAAPDFEIKCFMDVGNSLRGGIAYAKPLFSVSSLGWRIDLSGNREEFKASLRVADFVVHDLSAQPGIRAVGLSNSEEKDDACSFLTLSIELRRYASVAIIDVMLKWGKIQLLLLPSLVDSVLSVLKADWKIGSASPKPDEKIREESMWRPQNMLINLSLNTDGFECIISSKNIFDHVRAGSGEPINVVTFRWASSLTGTIGLVNSSSGAISEAINKSELVEQVKVLKTLGRFAENQLNTMVLLRSEENGTTLGKSVERMVGSVCLDLNVAEFQALRTCLGRVKVSLSAAGDSGDTPAVFNVRPPAAGEQRITNPINFCAKYRMFGTSVSATESGGLLDNAEVSQAFDLSTDMIDVLVYIRQSAGGMNDAYRVTLKPIAMSLKEAQRILKAESKGDGKRGKQMGELLKRTTTLGSASVKGCQVTLVPGGATRLTESPIIQFVMKNARAGAAVIDVPANFQGSLPPVRASLLGISGALRGDQATSDSDHLNQSMLSHATFAGWIHVDIAAHYHNRRLVAWEPLIEEWTADAKLGIDLVRVLSLAPSIRSDSALVASEKDIIQSSTVNTGERLRDIRRLFGSPFVSKQSEGSSESIVKSPSDMPYLLLVSMAPSLISLALHHTQSRELDFQHSHSSQRRVMKIPGLRRLEWLKQFGHPGFTGEKTLVEPAIQCALSDTKPLNINLTGALVENLATYMSGTINTNAIIPHWIRNETGLTIRFVEVLDSDRVKRGEQPKPVTLASGREIPLSLKRSISQSCDPHRAQITLELGSFEETVDRVNHAKYKVSKGSRSTTLFYRALGRISVDTVGIHELSFYENTELLSQSAQKATSAAGKIIVRISLKGGIKLVSIESPMVLCNATDQDLHCEIRDRNGISLQWSSIVPRGRGHDGDDTKYRASAPIPADLLSSIDDAKSNLSLSSLSETSRLPHEREAGPPTSVDAPLRYSRSSISKGIITESALSLEACRNSSEPTDATGYTRFTYLSACSLRLGSFETASSRQRVATRKPTEAIVPQQRMLLLRPPLVIANHLPVLMHLQVRTKTQGLRLPHVSSANIVGLAKSENRQHTKESWERQIHGEGAWTDLGVISCGKSVCWTGAQVSQEVEMQVKLMDVRDKSAEKFPSWSTISTIHAEADAHKGRDAEDVSLSMVVLDQAGSPLTLSVHVDAGIIAIENEESSGVEDVRSFAADVDQAPRVVCVTVPYWIVDSSAMQLEFLSNRPVAGQSATWAQSTRIPMMLSSQYDKASSPMSCLGLAEMVGNEQLELDPTTAPFEILMVGDVLATRLSMRQTRTRMSRANHRMSQYTSPWCEPIALHITDSAFTDIDVFPPFGLTDADDPSSYGSDALEPLALRAEVVKAPSKCGGMHGTRIVHVCNRYKIMNEMGRDIEISAGHGRGKPITVKATGYPVPFHFDDSSPIRFRPKEFGWLWSGKISVMKKRREVTLRLVHKLRGQVVIASMECLASSKSPSIILVFRNASQPPFRLENHTMYAFRFGQSSQFVTDEENQNWQRSDLSLDSTLLPYQHADFAWDEPDEGRRSVTIELGDTSVRGRNSSTESRILGTLALEKIAPGSNLKLSSRDFSGQIVADGPTRVLRITDAQLPGVSTDRDQDGEAYVNEFSMKDGALSIPSRIEVRLFHGIGISVVDWSPQELLYVSINDIVVDRSVNATHESVSIAAGHVSVDNQLWVTPYPVLLKAGRKQAAGRRRRNQAFELGWTRALAEQGGLMLLTNLDLAFDPITIRVDGAVVNGLVNMILHPIENKVANTPRGDQWLETEIRKVLRLGDLTRQKAPRKQTFAGQLLDTGEEFLATAAMAAKISVGSRSHLSGVSPSRVEPHKESSRHKENKRKIYIDRLKISTVKTEISWTGALPTFAGMSGMLRPALTFESLPVLLRPFTSYHVYGTNQDIAEGLKHHYVSVWRVFDVLVGLTFKPTFLIRAFVYTTRESVASFLDTVSQWCSLAEETLLKCIPKDMISKSSQSLSSSTISPRKGAESVSGLTRAVLGKPTLLMASSYRTWALVTASFASSLRYREFGGGLAVRTRNPRVFAHVDGKDLLVEHVEGENAGKALLSRVRGGQHLGEGYVFHTDNVHIRSTNTGGATSSTPQADLSSTPLILMVTTERILLLNGERKAKFCQVIWEALFSNMVHLEMADQGSAFFRLTKIWYLVDSEQSKGNTDDRLDRLAHTMVGDTELGLGMLMCKSLFVPRDLSKKLHQKIASVHKGVEEVVASSGASSASLLSHSGPRSQ